MLLPAVLLGGKKHAGSSRGKARTIPLHPFLAFAALSAIALPAPALAAGATAEARVVTVRPLTLIKTADLDWGVLAAGATAGTITIDPVTGARTRTGGVTALTGGTSQRAVFQGAAPVGVIVYVNLRNNNPVLTRVGGGATMTTALTVEGGEGFRLFPGTGVLVFGVGGQLNVAANQAQGSYLGTVQLQVEYF